jgi:DNA sulfur modification protein DndC
MAFSVIQATRRQPRMEDLLQIERAPQGPDTLPAELRLREGVSVGRALSATPDSELRDLYDRTTRSFERIYRERFPRWVVTFSGGKDSTLTLILAVDFLLSKEVRPRLDVVYSDTLVEIPAMRGSVSKMLAFAKTLGDGGSLNIRVHSVAPKMQDRFWYCIIGRGYPPPKPKFRWCTRRMKITPAAPIVATGSRTAVLTGVRFGESAQRTGRLVASCATGGECGQDFWFTQGPEGSNVSYFAPVVHWRTCKVWDFLHFVAPAAGWPTESVYNLYGDTNLRFGCWACTVVRRDRTMEALAAAPGGSEMSSLNGFRDHLLEKAADRKNRLVRNGHLGPFSLAARKELLHDLLALQASTGHALIDAAEVRAIRRFWATDAFAKTAGI